MMPQPGTSIDLGASWKGFSLVSLSQTFFGFGSAHTSLTFSFWPEAPKSRTIHAWPSSLGLNAVTNTRSEDNLKRDLVGAWSDARATMSGCEQATPKRAASSEE